MIFLFPILASCTGADQTDSGEDTSAPPPLSVTALPAPALLRRLSLDLRGVVPAPEELERVTADPAALEGLRDEFLADDRTRERLVDLLAEHWLTRVDAFFLDGHAYGLANTTDQEFAHAVGEEPLQLMAWIIASDQPYDQVVRSRSTVVNALLASIWPVTWDPGATEEWQVSAYTDQRPALGVLATNGLWWRYDTSPTNVNRHRAAALTKLLICEDFLARPVELSQVGVSGEDALLEAVKTDPSCQSCHSSLDPLAAALFGFWPYNGSSIAEMSHYHPEREQLGAYYLGADPGWFGTPLGDISELATLIADDPRFRSCAVETWASLLWRRPVTLDDFAEVRNVLAAFEADGLSSHGLLRGVLDTPTYTVGALGEEATDQDRWQFPPRRMMTDSQLGSAIEDLTGIRWTEDDLDMLRDDVTGMRVLAGGIDGRSVTTPEDEPGLTRAMVLKRLAQLAASQVVDEDLGGAAGARLLTGVDADTQPDEPAFEAQLSALRVRLHGQEGTVEDREADAALWRAVDELEGAQAAWTSVVAALLRDPAFWIY